MKNRSEFLNHFQNASRRAGLKLTQQRMEIYAELAAAADHPSPEILHRRLVQRMPTLSLDTVYRTLTTLFEHNLVQKVETVQSHVRFEVVHVPHHHLICRSCQEISDFPWDSFEAVALPKEVGTWGVIEKKSAVLTGICSRCRKKAGGNPRRKSR